MQMTRAEYKEIMGRDLECGQCLRYLKGNNEFVRIQGGKYLHFVDIHCCSIDGIGHATLNIGTISVALCELKRGILYGPELRD